MMSIELEKELLELLHSHPQGMSEFDILRHLQNGGHRAFDEALFKDNLAMYRAHFLLFHALYRLRDRLAADRQGYLEIHALAIRLHPWQASGRSDLAAADPMRDYYLDFANMEGTGAEEVERMLGAFWARYFADERRGEALAVLGLEEPVSARRIEERYRRLAMRLHPDRGGDKGDFQALQEAMAILRRSTHTAQSP